MPDQHVIFSLNTWKHKGMLDLVKMLFSRFLSLSCNVLWSVPCPYSHFSLSVHTTRVWVSYQFDLDYITYRQEHTLCLLLHLCVLSLCITFPSNRNQTFELCRLNSLRSTDILAADMVSVGGQLGYMFGYCCAYCWPDCKMSHWCKPEIVQAWNLK